MKQRFIARCTPSLGLVSIWWAQAVENILWPMNTGRACFYLKDEKGGEIAECRNQLVARALSIENEEREVTHVFWIDDDVICTRGVILQLLHHDRDIVSGVYFTKSPGNLAEPLIFPFKHGGTCRFEPDKAIEVWGHGMGLCLVKMDVYKRMQQELRLPPDKYGYPEWYRTTGRPEELAVKDQVLMAGGTEDLYFLERANQLGYQPLVDTGKHAFGFHFDCKRSMGYPEKQWQQFQKQKPVVWSTPQGDISWE